MIESMLGLEWVYKHKLQAFINAYYLGVSGDWVIRPSSIGTGPGSAAMMEYFGAMALFGLSVGARKWQHRAVCLCGAAIALGGVLLSAVRVVWLQTVLGAAAFVMLGGRLRIRRAVFLAIPAMVAVALSLFFSRGEINARFQTLETPVGTYLTEPSAAQRYYGLLLLPRVIADYPLGAGIGWNAPRQDIIAQYYGEEMVLHSGVHNYLSVLALEVGLPGLVVFVLLSLAVAAHGLRQLLREGRRGRRPLYAAYYALFVSLMLSFLIGGGVIGWPGEYYWIFGAVVLRLGQLQSDVVLPAHQAASAP
jgi:O-antigen ligase